MERFILPLCISLCCLAGCKPGTEDIGDLYGRWHLHGITNNDRDICGCDMVYISFMDNVYQYQPNWDYDWGTFKRSTDSLTLNPLAYQSAFGFHDLMHNESYDGLHPVSFKIQLLNDDEMVLQRSDSVWHFRKFLE